MSVRARWRALQPEELDQTIARLRSRPDLAGGAARHMFALSSLETYGPDVARIAERDDAWAVAIVFPGRLLVPCGAGEVIAEAGAPARRWRLLVGDVEAAGAVLAATRPTETLRVHRQTFMQLRPDRVPSAAELPDPGLRRARPADREALTQLAVRLHVDDQFGPDPGRAGARGYGQRIEEGIARGSIWCVGPVGSPVLKLEWAVSSRRWGVQIAGVVAATDVRGEGLGRAAIAATVRAALTQSAGSSHPDAANVTLHVREANEGARRAYRAAGFVETEEWRLAVRT